MSAYLSNLVQRSASTGTGGVVGPASTPAMLTGLQWRPATSSAPDVVAPADSSEAAATADARSEMIEPRSASQPHDASEPRKPQHKVHAAEDVSTQATAVQISANNRPAVSTSTRSQSPTPKPEQAAAVISTPVSLPADQAPVPNKLNTDNKPGAHDKDVANVQPRSVSPSSPDVVVQPSSDTSADRVSAALPTNAFQPPGRVETGQQTDTPVMTRTATLAAPDHAEAKPLADAKPVQTPTQVISQQTKTPLPQTIIPAPMPALRLPPAERAYRPGQKAGESPADIQVRIGRVEVRAAPDQQPPPAVAPAHTSARGFDDYISMRTYTRNNY